MLNLITQHFDLIREAKNAPNDLHLASAYFSLANFGSRRTDRTSIKRDSTKRYYAQIQSHSNKLGIGIMSNSGLLL